MRSFMFDIMDVSTDSDLAMSIYTYPFNNLKKAHAKSVF